eukprot:scaffold4591_cov30-Attheya_sp.AAC.1
MSRDNQGSLGKKRVIEQLILVVVLEAFDCIEGDDGSVCPDATTSFLVEEAILKDFWSSRMQGGIAVDPFVGATTKDPPIVTGSSLNFKTSSFCSLCANQDEDSMVDAHGTNFTTTGVVPSNNDMVCIFF